MSVLTAQRCPGEQVLMLWADAADQPVASHLRCPGLCRSSTGAKSGTATCDTDHLHRSPSAFSAIPKFSWEYLVHSRLREAELFLNEREQNPGLALGARLVTKGTKEEVAA